MPNQVVTGGTGSFATSFLQTLGVNAHVGTGTAGYQNSSLINSSLKYLGVDTIRTNFANTSASGAIINALANADIKFDFVTSSSLPATGVLGLTSYISSISSFANAHAGSIYAVEGLNEVNIQSFSWNGDSTMAGAASFQKALYQQVKGNASLAGVQVINLSVGYENLSDYKALGDLSKYADFSNSHAYTSTTTPADPVMEASMANAASIAKGKGAVITETGYTTYSSTQYLGTSELAQAKLTLAGLLNAYEDGSQKTFLYELFDSNLTGNTQEKERHFGLFNADGTPKKAATAIHNLTSILSSSDGGTGNTKTPAYSFSGLPKDGHANLLTKPGGVYDVVVWRDVLSWDDKNDVDKITAAATVTLDLSGIQKNVYVYNPMNGTTPIAVYHDVSKITLALGDTPLIVEVGAKGAVTEPVKAVDANLTMSAAALVAGIDTLHGSTGLRSITIDGAAVLRVSTAETMQYMVAKYQDVLSTIKGGYSFLVTTDGAGWRLEKAYSATGTLTATTDYAMVNGVPSSKHTVGTDGSEFSARYTNGLIVQSIEVSANKTRTVTNFDTTGKIALRSIQQTSETRTESYKNGVITNLVIEKVDGSRLTDTFDTSGRKLTEVVVDAAKTWTTLVYDASSGTVKNRYVKWADGRAENTTYGVTGQSYVTQTQTVDANGKLTGLVRAHADGTLDYSDVTAVNGTRTISYYDAPGRRTSETIVTAAGDRTLSSYDAASGKLSKQVFTLANGEVTTANYIGGVMSDRTTLRSDGSKVLETIAGGIRTVNSFNKTGAKTSSVTVDSLGTWTTQVFDVVTGKLSRSYVTRADGTLQNTAYNITGQAFTVETQTVDKNGKVIGITRARANGTLVLTDVTATDGSRTSSTYDNAGRRTGSLQISADGTRITTNYNVATGKLLQQVTDRSATVGLSVATINSFAASASASASAVTSATANQAVKVVDSFNADGILTSRATISKDGTWTTYAYDAKTAAVTHKYITYADGSLKNTNYGIQGQSFATMIQDVDANGKVSLVTRLRSDESTYSTEAYQLDGSQVISYFNNGEKQTSKVITTSDGIKTTLAFDVSTGLLAQSTVTGAKGTSISTSYIDGVIAATMSVDASGNKIAKSFSPANHDLTAVKSNITSYNAILIDDGSGKVVGSAANEIILADTRGMTLTGGQGADRFQIGLGTGSTTITDFGVGPDLLDISAFSKAGYQSTLTFDGSNTLMRLGNGDSVTLVGINPARVTASIQSSGLFAFG